MHRARQIATDRTSFRWVDCQLEALRRAPNPAAVRLALAKPPDSLHSIYKRTVANVSPDDRREIKTLLLWILFSAQPVSTLRIFFVPRAVPKYEGILEMMLISR